MKAKVIVLEIPVSNYREAKKFDGALIITKKDWDRMMAFVKKNLTSEKMAQLRAKNIVVMPINVDI